MLRSLLVQQHETPRQAARSAMAAVPRPLRVAPRRGTTKETTGTAPA